METKILDFLPEVTSSSARLYGFEELCEILKDNLAKLEFYKTHNLSHRILLNVIGANAWQRALETFYYRWIGEDTLTWGNPSDWITTGLLLRMLQEPQDFLCKNYSADLDRIKQLSYIDKIQDIYTVHLSGEVQRFLYCNPDVAEIILEAYLYLENYFGPAVEIRPEIIRDPEIPGHEQLMVYIVTCLPVDEALARMAQFDDEWFLDQLDRFESDLNFNLEIL
jgi:hypothetical protein